MRLIDADALRNKLENLADDDWNQRTTTSWAEAFTDCADMVEDAPTIEPEQRWIPCSERLPDEGERVLATHLGGLNPNRQVIEHIYQDGEFTVGWDMDTDMRSPTFGQRYMGEVIAWMPFPEPYLEGK